MSLVTPIDFHASPLGLEERSGPAAHLPAMSESLRVIAERFEACGAMGVLLVDVAALSEVESSFGEQARRQAAAALAAVVQEVGQERLDAGDLIVTGEIGRNEFIVLVFREVRDARFYRQELPGFEQSLRRVLEERGSRVFYPFLRSTPELAFGLAVRQRNPKYGVEAQVRHALDEAREDSLLNAKLEARRRRRHFLEMIFDRRISSVYEPIVEVETRTVFGYEALARGPSGTPLHSPLALFGTAEREDLVFELDCLCRESGLRGAIDFPSGTKLFLNVLPTTIHDPAFRADRLIRTLAECELSPSDVVFEISEQESIDNFEAFREMRDAYRALGFQFALDDTGSGYAGLEALLEISPEYIKVDRAFVSGVDHDTARQELLQALQTVAQKTGARIVGEGLDTLEELETLGRLGISFGQGWLFGRPTPLRAT